MMKLKGLIMLCCVFLGLPAFSGNLMAAAGGNGGLVYSVRPAISQEGLFIVEVNHGNGWQTAGELPYDKYLRNDRLDLSGLVNGNNPIYVRLTQKGGAKAHIDAVLLSGIRPDAVKGIGGNDILKKIGKKDDDLVSVGCDPVELSFTNPGKEAVLTLAARIENRIISRQPFCFPSDNMYRKIGTDSAYYSYKIGSKTGSPKNGSLVNRVDGQDPFYKEFITPGSGHPPGYIYTWVMNDDKYLYAAIDLTGDNTRDGDEDYTAIYIKCSGGVKEFKLTENDIRWGKPEFVYTDRVEHQHKFYTFQIPLEEVGIRDADSKEEILLAFAAYGTLAAPSLPDHDPCEVNYGDVKVRRASTVTVTVTNPWGECICIDSIVKEGDNPDQFVVTNDNCSGTLLCDQVGFERGVLADDESCTFDLSFRPTSTGEKAATVYAKIDQAGCGDILFNKDKLAPEIFIDEGCPEMSVQGNGIKRYVGPSLYTLGVTIDGTGTGTVTGEGIDCSPDCSEKYVEESTAVVSATAAAGSTFVGWSDDCSGMGDCMALMDGNKTVTATFDLADTDDDGVPDIQDECASDPNKTEPGICGCGVSDVDTDGDGTPDCNDNCPEDPDKTNPVICGCGMPDVDTDGDGTPDCNDRCPGDPDKIEPGVCGCGASDMDTDGDGTEDCNDLCPNDPDKTDPGVCGCGEFDVDTDEDDTPDCNDNCPEDPDKTGPGVCGCGVPDTDLNENGTTDCNEDTEENSNIGLYGRGGSSGSTCFISTTGEGHFR